ncbi:MAG: methionine biosynthesis protein MetW [Verrucomicrobiota bacterium]
MSERYPKSPFLQRTNKRRQIDFEILVDWIESGSRVLDLGCGRGILLRELIDRKNVYGIGVDSNPDKIASCIKRGVNAFQGDVKETMDRFEEDSFDYVVLTRTLELVGEPGAVIRKGLTIGRSVIVGAINHGFWKNRISYFLKGRSLKNDVYPFFWEDSPLSNHLSIGELIDFANREKLHVERAVYLRGDWKTRTGFMPNWLAGYGIFEITGGESSTSKTSPSRGSGQSSVTAPK